MPRTENLAPTVKRKSLSDWAHILFFGAIGWPWLLRSLSGGSPQARRALTAMLTLDQDALPHLGSWKADAGFLTLIAKTIFETRPNVVVELGCGATSLVAAKALAINGSGRLTGFDQHEDYIAAVRDWLKRYRLDADLSHAPLLRKSANWPGRWYEHAPAPDRIDLLIIDGPPWAIHPFVRGAADSLFSQIAPGGIVLLDDASRPGERVVAARWRKRWPDFEFTLIKAGTKGTLVGRRASAT